MRPIFSANDLKAALEDLADSRVFSQGYIQLPLHSHGRSHMVNRDIVYRYVYQLNKDPIVVELSKPVHAIPKKERLPPAKTRNEVERQWHALRPFVCPYLLLLPSRSSKNFKTKATTQVMSC